jgi:hypothetical protein
LRHGLTARTAVLPTETQLVHEIAGTAWRLNRIPFLEADLLSQDPSPQTLIPRLATLGLHGSRLSRQFQKAVDQLREIQEERHHLEHRQPPKRPSSSCAISAKDSPPSQPAFFGNKLASFFQKNRSSATHVSRCGKTLPSTLPIPVPKRPAKAKASYRINLIGCDYQR